MSFHHREWFPLTSHIFFLSPLSTFHLILSCFMRISKESSSRTSLLFSIRKRHDSQNEMVRTLIYNSFYGVRGASLNMGNVTEASRSNSEVYFRLQDRSHDASFSALSKCGVRYIIQFLYHFPVCCDSTGSARIG